MTALGSIILHGVEEGGAMLWTILVIVLIVVLVLVLLGYR